MNEETVACAKVSSLASHVWSNHKQEVLDRKVGKPMTLSEFDCEHHLRVERFGVQESRNGVQKVRVVENFRRNSVNSFSSLWERIWNDTQDDLNEAVFRLQRGAKVCRPKVSVSAKMILFLHLKQSVRWQVKNG